VHEPKLGVREGVFCSDHRETIRVGRARGRAGVRVSKVGSFDEGDAVTRGESWSNVFHFLGALIARCYRLRPPPLGGNRPEQSSCVFHYASRVEKAGARVLYTVEFPSLQNKS
jgi:hypothetical protein